MPNIMAAQLKIGGALCKSSVIPFLVPLKLKGKVYILTVWSSLIYDGKTWSMKVVCDKVGQN